MQFKIRGCHPLWPDFPVSSHIAFLSLVTIRKNSSSAFALPGLFLILWSCNPELSFRIARFRLFRFRSPLLSESRLFSLPLGTEMVHFPRFASYAYLVQRMIIRVRTDWVPPFGYSRIIGCLHLPETFRSWPRPSSPSCAKASPRMLLVA